MPEKFGDYDMGRHKVTTEQICLKCVCLYCVFLQQEDKYAKKGLELFTEGPGVTTVTFADRPVEPESVSMVSTLGGKDTIVVRKVLGFVKQQGTENPVHADTTTQHELLQRNHIC